MKTRLDVSTEIKLIGSKPNDLNQESVRCELCGNLLTNSRLITARTKSHVHYTCDTSCKMGLVNRLRMANPEFKSHISNLAKEQASRELDIRSERMKDLNSVIWQDEEFRARKSEEFKSTVDKLWQDPEYRLRHSNRMKSQKESKIKQGTHNFTDFESRCYLERDSLVARFSDRECAYIYECTNYDNHYKLGFTTDPSYRFSSSADRKLWIDKPTLLVKGSVSDIAELECQLKLNYSLRDKGMEVYDFNDHSAISNFIDLYIQSSTTIERVTEEIQ